MERYKDWNIKVPHFHLLEYYEGDKKMIVDFDLRDPVYYFSPRMIEHWENPYDDVEITMEDKRRILQNIRQYFLSRGQDAENIIMEDE